MTNVSSPCANFRLGDFVSGNMPESLQHLFQNHLDDCSACQAALEAAFATDDEWQEAQAALREAGTDSTQEIPAPGSNDNRRLFSEILTPSDDPQMMGRIAGYEICSVLGRGGMGVVFKGLDSSLNRYVAIKTLSPHLSASGTARIRFVREAQSAAAVINEHVIAIHAIAEWQGVPFLVMPLVKGMSLQKRIDENGPLQLRELLRIGMQIASGLAAAHAQGQIHRDVKPANILMEDGVDRVVLTDFGLARAIDDIRLTRTDTLVGTPLYMSPEQTKDEPLDFRTDLFSLGSVLYEAATGRAAFRALTSYSVIRCISEDDPERILHLNPDIPPWFEGIVCRLMAKSPDDRFASAQHVAELLQQCLLHVQQPHLTELPDEVRKPPVNSLFSIRNAIMSSVFVASVIGLSMLWPSGSESSPTPESAEFEPELAVQKQKQKQKPTLKFRTAKEAFGVGAALYNARNFDASREPFEAALKLGKDDAEMKLKCYEALLPSYRKLPEFGPFQTAAEYVIANSPQQASRSLTRRSLVSFAYQRGQIENLIRRYEKRLQKNPDEWISVYLLTEIYTRGAGVPDDVDAAKRSIVLLKQLETMEAERVRVSGKPVGKLSKTESAKMAREKAKLANQYKRAKEYKRAATLYEEIAPLDETTHAWNLKEAASAWLKLNNKKEALRLAKAAEKTPAESRNDQLTHFFERGLGDIFMAVDQPAAAIPHYKIALEKTTIPGYVDATKTSLEKAIELGNE